LFHALLKLFLAALAGVAVLMGWWAWQNQAPVETTPKASLAEVPDVVVMPAPLEPQQPAVMDAAVRLDRPRIDDCLVEFVGHGNTPASTVVAILDAVSGAHLARSQLAARKLPFAVRFPDIPDGEHWAVLARHDSELRYAYLSRARLKRHARAGGRRVAALRGQAHDLLVELASSDPNVDPADPPAMCRGVPVLLRRRNDPDWRYREPEGNGDSAWLLLTDKYGKIRLRQLGAGRYLLRAEGFEQTGSPGDTDSTPEWMPLTMDRDRSLKLTGSAR